jgi:DNA polymerase III subunit alpha
MKIRRSSSLWNLHAHSRFSAGDALPTVADMVKTVASYGQPALGLTDHGNMAGAVQLYTECAKAGIKPFPGSELYVVHDRNDKKAKRHHMCVVAYTTEGYANLVKMSTRSYANFYHKPLLDHADLAEMSEAGMLKGIAATSGCYFGFIAQSVATGDPMSAESYMNSYAKWFDRFYVELQNHNIDHGDGWNDDLLADELMSIAQRNGIPCVLTQDSHYCHQEEQEIHNALKRLVSFGSDPDDATFPGDGFGLADTGWFRAHHHDARFDRGREGLADLLAAHDLSIPQLDKYHYNIPFIEETPDAVLEKRCRLALDDMRLREKRYVARLDDELEIIKDTGMAGYLLLVEQVTDWCRANQVFYQARGSASGSMVCWLLGITQADPLKWGLSFERFISRDRTKPPDIDLDVEKHRRKELIAYLQSRYAVVQIGTWAEFSLQGDEEADEDGAKGSLRVRYYSAQRKSGKPVGNWDSVPEADKAALYAIADRKPFSGYGTHAAGLVVTTSASEIDNLVPLMKVASSDTTVTQYEMDDVEKLGLVKLDVLGLKTLSVLHLCMDNLGRDVFRGLDWIPLSDAKTYAAISRGDTAGVFQLEGGTAARGCRRLRPSKIADIIAAMALFRPATMNSGATDSYIMRKQGEESVPERHEIIVKHTAKTYGIMLFQEQVISILRELGMTPDDLTAFLKAVKASNSSIGDAGKVIDGYKQRVHDMAVDAGFRKADWLWLWEAIEGFAAYGFNQAHSTAYGLTAYRCAYLATNHPLEYFAALLAYAATGKVKGRESKETTYLSAARSRGVKIRRADVNVSGISYTVDHKVKAIRKGLSSIKGVGDVAANDITLMRPPGGYTSLEHFARSLIGSKVTGIKPFLDEGDTTVGTFGKLYEAGALEGLS